MRQLIKLLLWLCYTPVTEKRPTLAPPLAPDVALDTWKRPMVVA